MDTMVVDIPQSDMVRMEQILKDEKAHTVDSPGEWKGLEDTHIPVVTKNGDGSVVVQVAMDKTKGVTTQDDHFVEWIFVVDHEKNIVARAKFGPKDESFVLTTTISAHKEHFAYAYCNQHGLWQGPRF